MTPNVDLRCYRRSWMGLMVMPSPELARMAPEAWDNPPSASVCQSFFREPLCVEHQSLPDVDAKVLDLLGLPASFTDAPMMKHWVLSARLVRIYLISYNPKDGITLRHTYVRQSEDRKDICLEENGERKVRWHAPDKFYYVTRPPIMHDNVSSGVRAQERTRMRRYNQILPVLQRFHSLIPSPDAVDSLPPLLAPESLAVINGQLRLEQLAVSFDSWKTYIHDWVQNHPLLIGRRLLRRTSANAEETVKRFGRIVSVCHDEAGHRGSVVTAVMNDVLGAVNSPFSQQLFEAMSGVPGASSRVVPLSLLPDCRHVQDVRMAIQGPIWGEDSTESLSYVHIDDKRQFLDLTCSSFVPHEVPAPQTAVTA